MVKLPSPTYVYFHLSGFIGTPLPLHFQTSLTFGVESNKEFTAMITDELQL
jgi:hypothetical protein